MSNRAHIIVAMALSAFFADPHFWIQAAAACGAIINALAHLQQVKNDAKVKVKVVPPIVPPVDPPHN